MMFYKKVLFSKKESREGEYSLLETLSKNGGNC